MKSTFIQFGRIFVKLTQFVYLINSSNPIDFEKNRTIGAEKKIPILSGFFLTEFTGQSMPVERFRPSTASFFPLSLFRYIYKTMTKQIVSQERSGFRLQFHRQSAFKTQHCWRGLVPVSALVRIHEKRKQLATFLHYEKRLFVFFFFQNTNHSQTLRFLFIRGQFKYWNASTTTYTVYLFSR